MTIQKHDVSWMCDRVKHFDTFLKPGSTLQMIFQGGGYIAGGFLRMLLRNGTLEAMPKYFGMMGDIDVFFPNQASYDAVKQQGLVRDLRPSLGKNAEQGMLRWFRRDPIWDLPFSGLDQISPIAQLVNVMFHEPAQMLETFDIVNCKVAFDGKNIYIDDRVEQLERDRLLQLDMAGGSRVEKYFRKHGYKALHPESKGVVMNWLAERYTNQDWGRINRGENIVASLMTLGPSVIPDDALVGFIGKFKSEIKSVNYAEMVVSTKVNRFHREYIKVDVAAAELNRRHGLCTIAPGDLVEVASKDRAWSCCMLLGRATEPGVWHVLFTTGMIATIHELGIVKVLSDIKEVVNC